MAAYQKPRKDSSISYERGVVMSKLQDALNHHQSTLKQAFTPQDKAVNEILLLISGEVQALHNEMATLRRDLMLFSQKKSSSVKR